MRFKDLAIGQWFDFIEPNSIFNSFYKRVEKIDRRKYRDADGIVYTVGSIKCEVYNVSPMENRNVGR